MPNVLRKPQITREKFDPTNANHMASFKHFVRTGNWGDVQFYSQLPYNEVPMTVMMTYIEHMTGIKRETANERLERLMKIPGLLQMPEKLTPAEERQQIMAEHVAANKARVLAAENRFAKT